MKLFFMSDIHGSLHFLKLALEAYKKEEANYIIMLGDALYHGPRNVLPQEYNPGEVAKILNQYKHNIIAVKGNCDSEVDQMIINFPMMSDYSFVLHNERRIFLSHGHKFSPDNLPELSSKEVFAYGHTHIPIAESRDGIYIINPGSISLPKENYPNSYGILNENRFQVKDLMGNTIKEIYFE